MYYIKEESIIRPLPSDEILNKEERLWRIKLPEEFRAFIKLNNGGIPTKTTFQCRNHSYAIDRFLCVLENADYSDLGVYDIDVVLSQIEERLTDNDELVGVELLPIAVLFAGDFICLNFKNKLVEPTIVIWNHEESGEFAPVTYHVADSFSVFLNMLA